MYIVFPTSVLYSNIIIVGSQINITGANKVVIGDDITINIPEVIINHMKRNKKEEDVRSK